MTDFDFGFDRVGAHEKAMRVRDVFRRVAQRYDLMNDVMSLGMHRLWKKAFVQSLPLRDGGGYLDVAAGTGDIGSAITKRLQQSGFQAHVILSDSNPAMIAEGQVRFPTMRWICCSAEALPIKSNEVDIYTISFGLRNITHREKALQEAYRVLKPGGHFACLEFFPSSGPFRQFYDLHVLPMMGELIAHDRAAYQYLAESIRTFLNPPELLQMMQGVGFMQATYEILPGRVVAIHRGYKG